MRLSGLSSPRKARAPAAIQSGLRQHFGDIDERLGLLLLKLRPISGWLVVRPVNGIGAKIVGAYVVIVSGRDVRRTYVQRGNWCCPIDE